MARNLPPERRMSDAEAHAVAVLAEAGDAPRAAPTAGSPHATVEAGVV
jgi:hypothetical protein